MQCIGTEGGINKDCRKRWHKIGPKIRKGPWTAAEDRRLQEAVDLSGLRWTQISEVVRSRNADQCSKRWRYALNPDVTHSPWTEGQDGILLRLVAEYGHNWGNISATTFRDRSTVDIKNRSVSLLFVLKAGGQAIAGRTFACELRYFLLQRKHRDSTASSRQNPSTLDEEDNLSELSWSGSFPQYETETALSKPVKPVSDQMVTTATTAGMMEYQIPGSAELQGDYAALHKDLLVPYEDAGPVDADYLFMQNLDPALVADDVSLAPDRNSSTHIPMMVPLESESDGSSRLSTLILEGVGAGHGESGGQHVADQQFSVSDATG